MTNTPLRRRPETPSEKPKPKIWAEGGQRPPFDIRALARATLFLSREAVAPLHASVARAGRRAAENVRNGVGRIPEEKLGRAAPWFPSHLRVAAWIKNLATTFAHASANADPDVKRGNALVAEIEPHLWPEGSSAPTAPTPEPPPAATGPEPVVLPEPVEPDDPLASIRSDIDRSPKPRQRYRAPARPGGPAVPPPPPGPAAEGAIQVFGYLIGWATAFVALPYGLIVALWLYLGKSQDLRKIGLEE